MTNNEEKRKNLNPNLYDTETLWKNALNNWERFVDMREYVLCKVRDSVEAERWFNFQDILEQFRKDGRFSAADGEDFKFNNSLVPAYQRLALIEIPEARLYCSCRRCRFDKLAREYERETRCCNE